MCIRAVIDGKPQLPTKKADKRKYTGVLKIWRVKLPEDAISRLEALAHVGVILNGKYDKSQLVIDMMAVFEENRPSVSRTAETYLDVFKDKQPDEPVSELEIENAIEIFLKEAISSKYYYLFDFAARTGLRKNEILALKWSDLDMDTGVITVSRNLLELPSGCIVKGYTCPFTIQVPKELLQELAINIQRNTGTELVFCKSGGIINPRALTHEFYSIVKIAGLLHNFKFHDFRRAYLNKQGGYRNGKTKEKREEE